MDFLEIVKEVQKIGAAISDGRASLMNYQDANGIRVIDQENNVRKYSTINECVINKKLCRATITKHIKNKSKRRQNLYYLLNFFIFICYVILRSA